MNPRSSILWLARMRFFDNLRIREFELARRVARTATVIALDRSDARGWDDPHLMSKIILRWDMARGGWGRWDGGEVARFRMPVMVGTGPLTNRIASWINERRVREALDKFGCGTVFHSHPLLFLPPERGRRAYRVHFDLVDNFFDGWPDSTTGRSRKHFIREAMLRADSLSTVSHSLCDRVEEFIGRRPVYIPNGAAVEQIKAWPAERAAAVRARHGLVGRRVLAYIGNHIADFDGTEMLVEAFLQARESNPDLALLLIGPGSERVPRARRLGVAEGVYVIGPVPTGEIWDYFHAADLGLLPFILAPVTHHCLPLKVLEFGASGKPVLATPLHELQRLALPHIRFAEYDSAAWRRALLDDATYAPPDPLALEKSLLPFSWDAATAALLKVMGLD
ncbi:MAG TPA: glycosyltransferase family 4 protein [Candidatus Polarisedimenticolia bacterium]|jgi:glycosyltransferase involved in cell wall biosynthesis